MDVDARLRRKWGEVKLLHGNFCAVWRQACVLAGARHVRAYDEAIRKSEPIPGDLHAQKGADSHYPEVIMIREALNDPDAPVWHLRGGNHEVTVFGITGKLSAYTLALLCYK